MEEERHIYGASVVYTIEHKVGFFENITRTEDLPYDIYALFYGTKETVLEELDAYVEKNKDKLFQGALSHQYPKKYRQCKVIGKHLNYYRVHTTIQEAMTRLHTEDFFNFVRDQLVMG